MSTQKSKPGQTYFTVFVTFCAETALIVCLSAVFTVWNHAINWNAGPVAIAPQLAAASIIGGFVSGLMTRSIKKSSLPGIILAIILWVGLDIVDIIWIILYTLSLTDAVPITLGTAGSSLNIPGFVSFFIPYPFCWYAPVYIIMACTIPSSMVGGFISLKFIKVSPPRRQLTFHEQVEKLKTPLFVVIFAIVWIPLLVPLFSGNNNVQKEYSAWNTGDSGTSQLREQIQAAGYTNIYSSLTSYSELLRINESSLLIVLGPNRFFNPVSDIPFLEEFIRNKGSLLIAHEEGSTEWLFTYLCIASLLQMASTKATNPFPMAFFMQGILRDNASYYEQNDFPVISAANIISHPVMNGVNSLVMNHASALMFLPGMASLFGWNVLATSTSQYSWVDKAEPNYPNGNGIYDPSVDVFKPSGLSIPRLLFTFLKSEGISFPDGIPQGGYALPVIAESELSNNGSRIIVTSDASMFSNQLIKLPGFDNLRFALNCVNWLTRGNHSMKIIFDEYHLRPDTGVDVSAPAMFGQLLDYISFLSSNWVTAPFYPFAAFIMLRRWLPKSEEQLRKKQENKQKKESRKARKANRKARSERQVLGKLLFEHESPKTPSKTDIPATKTKTPQQKRAEKQIARMGIMKKSTFFAQKLQWYMEKSEFNHALELLYNRIKRLASKKIGEDAKQETIINAIVDKFPQVDRKKIDQFFNKMERIVHKGARKQKITRVESFENLYYEIVTIGEYLEKM